MCAHIAYVDDKTVKMLRAANQTSGCLPGGGGPGSRGKGDFNFDGDDCLDGDQDRVDSRNRGDG